ncbi:DUF7344 domain-containing protein [Haladaptatus caseinilyticus]|uniref:DUF7344 domain-containing protein n=1 Tax=Haladaptatus caseinilyticus TaxID=2993314 RepID=UPI00224AC118|nr:hypothetical protein [Haladaptatus caseinilyticus]
MFSAVGTSQRRSILATLNDEDAAMSEQELALRLAEGDQKVPETDVTPEIQTIHTNLNHAQLPLLEDNGFIEWNQEEGTVTTTDHRAFEDPQFERFLEIEHDEVDDALAGLANKHRRLLLAILRDTQESMSKTALAQKIHQRDNEGSKSTQTATKELVVMLSHVHLPLLSDAEIVEYNEATGHAVYTEHSGLEELITHFHRPYTRIVTKLDQFLGGLLTTYTKASNQTADPFDWPTSWRDSTHG